MKKRAENMMLKITAVTPRSSAAMRCTRRHKLAPHVRDQPEG